MIITPPWSADSKWFVNLFPSHRDALKKDAGDFWPGLLYHTQDADMDRAHVESLLESQRYVSVPLYLDRFCRVFRALLEEEYFNMADIVGVAIRRMLVEHWTVQDESILDDDERLQRMFLLFCVEEAASRLN